MSELFYALLKMSLQGIAIILIVGLVRFLLTKFHVGHKYIVGLWLIVFFYLIFPWKISLPVGFWGNTGISEESQSIIVNTMSSYESTEDNADKIIDNHEIDLNYGFRLQESVPEENSTTLDNSEEFTGNLTDDIRDTENRQQSEKVTLWNVLSIIWMLGVAGFVGHYIYSYIVIQDKISMSIPYKNNIMWSENIGTPMVFGILCPKIYLPISVERENFPYIVAHERMHIKRKDSLFKITAYFISIIHWFNPFVWAAFFLLGSDIEKACDEEVIRKIGEEYRKEYAYSLLHIASGEGMKKKRIFVAPICFDEGNVKDRIKNITQYKYTLSGIGAVVLVLGMILAGVFLTQTKSEATELDAENAPAASEANEETESQNNNENEIQLQLDYPAFYVEDLDTLQIEDTFSLEDYYITSRYTASNYFYIDENGTLWGTGMNHYGQLGTGTYVIDERYDEPVKIAEKVVSVDASWNDYFCIYLTENGELYGVGLNYAGLLLGKGSEQRVFSFHDYQKVTKPVLLMNNVAYARAGRESIVALQKDKTAYWWGQYAPLTHSKTGGDYWSVEEDDNNPAKMFASEPLKIMENCKYITTGTFTGAAISEAGELYTWGFNVFGQCGAEVTDDDFIRSPVKVLDDVKMVWVDKIEFSDPIQTPSDFIRRDIDYSYNTFVLTNDNSLLAAGLNLGNKKKLTEVNGDIVETQLHLYTDTFMPVRAIEYSETANREKLNQLMFGMSMEEVEAILQDSGLDYFQSISDENTVLCIEDSRYYCYFDKQGEFERLLIQEGASRDNRFALGISLSDLEEIIKNSGGSFTKESDDIYSYTDNENKIKYGFQIYEGNISVLWEEAIVTVDGGTAAED